MKIAIEAQRIFRSNKHGMDFVALESIRNLQQIDKKNEYFIFVKPGTDRCLQSSDNFHIIELYCPTYILWEQVALPLAIKNIKPDLLHCTSNTAPLLGKTPLVLTLHDIIFLEKKSGFNNSIYQQMGRIYRKWIVPRIVPKCKKIITVSDYEKERIQNRFPEQHNKIIRIYNGLSSVFAPERKDKSIVCQYIPTESYLFFLGNTDPKKNTRRVLNAYALYLQRSQYKRPLLIADINEKEIDILLAQENIAEIKAYLHLAGYFRNPDLPAIYAGAFAFLYPSLRESFGLPLLESMACGTPVVSSTTSAIPEIAGEGAILIDPTNEEELAAELVRLESNPIHYEQQTEYGLKRAALFSWKKTAEELLYLYQTIK